MSLIKLEDTLMDIMAKMSAGNPGAINVLIQIYKESPKIDPQDFMQGLGPILGLDTHKIYGPDIWILYKDVCGSSILNVLTVLRSIQMGIIPERKVKDAIFECREGVNRGETKLDLPQLLKDLMEQLEEFNRADAAKPEEQPEAQPASAEA